MKVIGEKGQAFSTFKLLIAAIVAMVILVILLGILGVLPIIPNNKPLDEVSNTLKSAYGTHSQLSLSKKVTFTRDYVLARKALINKADIGLSEKQLCLSLGDFSAIGNHGGFEGGAPDNEAKIAYTGSTQKDASFAVLCDIGESLPGQMGQGATYESLKPKWAEDCECVKNPDLSAQVCCFVALKFPR